jgi:hypothetical protein
MQKNQNGSSASVSVVRMYNYCVDVWILTYTCGKHHVLVVEEGWEGSFLEGSPFTKLCSAPCLFCCFSQCSWSTCVARHGSPWPLDSTTRKPSHANIGQPSPFCFLLLLVSASSHFFFSTKCTIKRIKAALPSESSSLCLTFPPNHLRQPRWIWLG